MMKKTIILENTSVNAAYRKYFSDIPEEIYKKLVETDPTYDKSKPDIMGKYGIWILNRYRKDDVTEMGLPKLGFYLSFFNRFINRMPSKNIQDFKDIDDLIDAVQWFIDNPDVATSNAEEKKRAKEGAELVYRDNLWFVYKLNTKDAAIYYGKGTKWCTSATKSDNWFDNYNSIAPLYVNIRRQDGKKYQFHFGKKEFKDETNQEIGRPVDETIGMTDGLCDFYRKLTNGWSDIYFNVDEFESFWGGFALVRKNGKENFINESGKFLSEEWFDKVSYFSTSTELSSVTNNSKSNWLRKDGTLLSDKWFDIAGEFRNGFARVQLNGKENLIGLDGNILSDKWFDRVWSFDDEGKAGVKDGDKEYYIHTDGQLSETRFKKVIIDENIIKILEKKKKKPKSKPYTKNVGNITKVNSGLMAYEEREPDYEIGFEEGGDGYAHVVNENGIGEFVNPDEVDLSSFKIKKSLNKKFWKNDKLDSRIRLKLLDIADDFTDSLDVNWVKVKDIIMTGSLANYNWSEKHSDIDLHIVMDYSKVDERVDFVREYFKMKKDEWNSKHENLTIFGFPVEVYVQDSNEKHISSGMYSLEKNKWLKEPEKGELSDDFDKDRVKKDASTFMTEIDELEDNFKDCKSEYEYRKVFEKAEDLFAQIKKVRKDGFESGGEMNAGNITFKTLRRTDYIGKLLDIKDMSYDRMNSIE